MKPTLEPTQMENLVFLNLRKFFAPEIVYGSSTIELAGRHAMNFGASKAPIDSRYLIIQVGLTAFMCRT